MMGFDTCIVAEDQTRIQSCNCNPDKRYPHEHLHEP